MTTRPAHGQRRFTAALLAQLAGGRRAVKVAAVAAAVGVGQRTARRAVADLIRRGVIVPSGRSTDDRRVRLYTTRHAQ